MKEKPTTTITTTTTNTTTTTTTTQRLVPGLLDGPCPPSRRARPIAEQNTNKTKHPPFKKNKKPAKARYCAGVCEAPRGLCEFRCRGMMHHDGSSLKLLAMPLGIGVAWAQRDGIRAPLVAFNVASAGLSRFGPPDTGDDNTNNDKT